MELRIGLGEDRHRLDEPGTGPLRIGGIDVPHGRGLIGHSDADVLLHAVTDALLGAAGLEDIGEIFPNTDGENRGRDSRHFLRHAYELVRAEGFELVNLDCVVSAQRPKLAPHKDSMRRVIAETLEVPAGRVGLKAKTGEGVGPVGREEAIDARCVALVRHETDADH
ncbi:2-C-methyl-D-erythritol 2,4-cyclodiphosphate synthase [Pseudobythopirellula maris]|uniref:2-C-methyl-D-erythritol 2,4-cyclodiphosphate synthase n=1 Tax=Pseudobythopirellula maris TaxID=2527991 RepID=A0A5C5ZI14_9BACT|nr:2-C-methyl-D-erythritol 2,4-cyclodiphosphate synthase [Pseudobythopirellula maris]TWT86876.1 2-C-methyl-D-erythritol 2,4-cyclodiphosphate synthase [Pseudobythopirellula maris]